MAQRKNFTKRTPGRAGDIKSIKANLKNVQSYFSTIEKRKLGTTKELKDINKALVHIWDYMIPIVEDY